MSEKRRRPAGAERALGRIKSWCAWILSDTSRPRSETSIASTFMEIIDDYDPTLPAVKGEDVDTLPAPKDENFRR